MPDFLALPSRPGKPRSTGLTHVIDSGLPLQLIREWLDLVGPQIDIWKFGYGLSYIDRQLGEKVALLESHDVKACPGGTLLEVCWQQRRVDECLRWLHDVGFGCVEVSNGASSMPGEAKRGVISAAAEIGFNVIAEVGSKDPEAIADPAEWALEAKADLNAGASWIVAEGRESGNVGLYDPTGEVRGELVLALEAVTADANVIYEAPLRAQQAWLIGNVGTNVNVGNIAVADVLSVEALRLGLRADTMTVQGGTTGGPCSS